MELKTWYYMWFILGIILSFSYNQINKYVWWIIFVFELIIIFYIIYQKINRNKILSKKNEDLDELEQAEFPYSMFKKYLPLLLIGSIIFLGIGIVELYNKKQIGAWLVVTSVTYIIYSIYYLFKYRK